MIGADVAEGRVRDRTQRVRRTFQTSRPDYSAAVVLEKETGRHVATWHGYQQAIHFAAVLAALGWHYNEALLVPEINGPGLSVIEQLVRVIGYPMIYTSKIFGMELMDGGELAYGWRTTVQTRAILVNRIEEMIASSQLDTRDHILAKELRTFQIDEQGVPRARAPDKDDLVMALGLALQGRYETLVGTVRQSETRPRRGPDDWVWEQRQRELARAEQRQHARLRNRGFTPRLGGGPRFH